MAICPNCNVDVTGSFCPICGLSVAQMGAAPVSPGAQQPVQPGAQPQTQGYQQPYQQPPGGPPGAYGPPIGVLLGRSPMAKMGIVIMILAIIGLVLAAVVPWIITEKEVGGDYEYNYVCQDCGYSDEDWYWTCPQCGSSDIDLEEEFIEGEKKSFSFNNELELVDGDEEDWGDDEFTPISDVEDYLKGSVGLAFWGLLLAIILAISLIVVGVMAASGKPSAGLMRGMGVIIAACLIFPGAMMIVSGMNFLGFNITEMHTNSIIEELGGEVTQTTIFPAAYIMLIFGILIFLIAFMVIKTGLQKVTEQPQAAPYQQTQPPMQPQQPVPPQYPGGGARG